MKKVIDFMLRMDPNGDFDEIKPTEAIETLTRWIEDAGGHHRGCESMIQYIKENF